MTCVLASIASHPKPRAILARPRPLPLAFAIGEIHSSYAMAGRSAEDMPRLLTYILEQWGGIFGAEKCHRIVRLLLAILGLLWMEFFVYLD